MSRHWHPVSKSIQKLATASTTKPKARLGHLKKIPLLFNCVVEALYRGEHNARKASSEKAASVTAEEAVASGLCLSPATVHKRCSAARREWRGASPELPALTLVQFEKWLQFGRNRGSPRRLKSARLFFNFCCLELLFSRLDGVV
jgi:hypothetical protein